MYAVVIHPEGDSYIVGHPDEERKQYECARLAIGCKLIERVRADVDGYRVEMWVDEEGIMNELAYNQAACRVAYGIRRGLLVGRAYVTGPDLSPLTLEQATRVKEIADGTGDSNGE